MKILNVKTFFLDWMVDYEKSIAMMLEEGVNILVKNAIMISKLCMHC